MNTYFKMVIVIIMLILVSIASFYVLGGEGNAKVAEIVVHTSIKNGSVDIVNIEAFPLEDVSRIGFPRGNMIIDSGSVSVNLNQDMIPVSDWYSTLYRGTEGSQVYKFKVGLYDDFNKNEPVKVYANIEIFSEQVAAADKYILLNYSSDDN